MTGRDAATPPLPDPDDPVLGGYWAAAAHGKLVVQQCAACDRVQWPPRDTCGRCGPAELRWLPVAGIGTLFTWTVVHHTTVAAYADALPFAVGAVELDDVPARMLGRLRGVSPEKLEMDMPVEVVFEPVASGISLPVWQPAGRGSR